jgi:hypothetical protein
MWKMVLLCLFVVSLEGKNDRSFEDHERTVVELKSLFFYSSILFTFG